MQYWLCEYQCERDVAAACRKLNGFPCHGTTLKVVPALKHKAGFEVMEKLSPAPSTSSARPVRCRVCDKTYTNSSDLKTHLLLSHCLYVNKKPSHTPLMRGKVVKERPCSKTHHEKKLKEPLNVKQWVEGRPHRNPDYEDPQDYVLDSVIGVNEENDKLGFIPIDHMYAEVKKVVRGTIPNSVLNGPESITFHPSMVCLMKHDTKLHYVPVEHSYCMLDPQALWCSVCGRQYNSLESLNNHLPVHFKKKGEKLQDNAQVSRKRKLKRAPKDEIFTCKMCSCEFNTKSTFIAHVTAHENDDEMEVVNHKCKYCEMSFTSPDKMGQHQALHECGACQQTFNCLDEAQSHRDSHVLLEKAKCCCEVCGKKFLDSDEFLEHLSKENHPVTKQSRRILSIPRHAEHFNDFTFQARNEEFHCLKCSKTCESDLELYSHMGFHFVYKTIPPPYVLPPEVEEVSQTSDESPVKDYEPVKVRIPLSTILNATALASPVKEAPPEEVVELTPGSKVCPRCSKGYKSYRSLCTHFRFCKTKPLPPLIVEADPVEPKTPVKDPIKSPPLNFKCIKCDLGFISEFLLKSHINIVHQNEEKAQVKLGKARKSAVKLYKCSDCDKTFAQELGLKAHHAAAHSDFSSSKPTETKTEPVSSLKKVLEDCPKLEEPQDEDTQEESAAEKSEPEIIQRPVKPRGVMKSPPSHETSGIIRARKTAAKLFKCKTCDIRFGSKRILAFHMQQHADGKIKQKEPVQPQQGILSGILDKHDPPENDAMVAGRKISSDSADQEMQFDDVPLSVLKSRKVAKKTIIKKVFECDICDELFTKRSQYISHIKSHTNDPAEVSSMSEEEEDIDKEDQEHQEDISKEESFLSNDFSNPSDNTDSMEVSVPLPMMNDNTDIIPADAIFYVDDDKLDGLMDEASHLDQTLNSSVTEIDTNSNNLCANGDASVEEVKTCNICKKQFLAWSTICAHMSTHPNSTFRDVTVDWKSMFNPLFECVICQEKVHSVAHCYLHYKYHVLENSSTAVISHLDVSAEGDKSLIIKCSVCGNIFDKIGTLHTHMKIHVPRVGFNDPTQIITDPSHEKCEICHRVVTPKSRRRHYQIHDQPLKHFCEICLEEFPDQKGYIIHYCQAHKVDFENELKLTASASNNGRSQSTIGTTSSGTADFHCTYCRSSFLSLKSKRNHEYKHKKNIFKIPCVYTDCFLSFQTAEELVYHVDKVGHATGPQTIPCSQCEARFLSAPPKLKHEKEVHGIDGDLDGVPVLSPPQQESTTLESPVNANPPTVNCKVCSMTFETMEKLQFHEKYEHLEGSDNTIKVFVDKKNTSSGPKEEEFSCMICRLKFSSYSERWLHEEEFEKPGSYRCMDCGLDYKTKHQKTGHECNTRALTPDTPNNVSPSGKPLVGFKQRKCHACNKLFSDKESFKYHVRKHWYRCFSCHYDFCSKKSMKAHLKLQKCFHPKTQGFDRMFDELQVECLLCSQVMPLSDHINLHFLEHTIKENGKYDMFICLMCGAPYKIIEQLQEHMRTEGYFLVCREAPHLKDLDLSSFDGNRENDTSKECGNAASLSTTAHQWGCPFCSTTYQNYKSAWSHIRSYHKSVGVPFKLDGSENVDGSENGVQSGDVGSQKPVMNTTQMDVGALTNCGHMASSASSKLPNSTNNCPPVVPSHPPPKIPHAVEQGHRAAQPSPSVKQDSTRTQEVDKARLLLSELLNGTQEMDSSRVHSIQKKPDPLQPRPTLLTTPEPSSNSEKKKTTPSRSRNESESSVSSGSNKKPPSITSPEAAAKTAGLIAQFLRGPGSSSGPLLPTPKMAGIRPSSVPNGQVRPSSRPYPSTNQYRDFINSRPQLHHGEKQHDSRPVSRSGSYPPADFKQGPQSRPYQNENLRRNFGSSSGGNHQQFGQGSRVNRGPDRGYSQPPPYHPYNNGYTSNKRMRFDHPSSNSQQHHRPQSAGNSEHHHRAQPGSGHQEHPTSENSTWQSELNSRNSSSGNKTLAHKCTYCQRIFKNYINVYNHLVRSHLEDVSYRNGGQIKPVSSFDGRMTVWSLST